MPTYQMACLLLLGRLLDGIAQELDHALGAYLPQRPPLLSGSALRQAVQQGTRVGVVGLGLFMNCRSTGRSADRPLVLSLLLAH